MPKAFTVSNYDRFFNAVAASLSVTLLLLGSAPTSKTGHDTSLDTMMYDTTGQLNDIGPQPRVASKDDVYLSIHKTLENSLITRSLCTPWF